MSLTFIFYYVKSLPFLLSIYYIIILQKIAYCNNVEQRICENGAILQEVLQNFGNLTANRINNNNNIDSIMRVKVHIRIKNVEIFTKLNPEISNYMRLLFEIEEVWKDERLQNFAYDCDIAISDHFLIEKMSPQRNRTNATLSPKLFIRADGTAVLNSREYLRTIECRPIMNARMFPFTNITCLRDFYYLVNPTKINNSTINISNQMAKISVLIDAVTVEIESDLPDILTVNYELIEQNKTLNENKYYWRNIQPNKQVLLIHLTAKHLTSKLILEFYLPSVLILLISWISFALGPLVVTRAVATIGALILLFVHFGFCRNHLPKFTSITPLDIWMAVTMVFALIALLELALVSCIASIRRPTFRHICRKCSLSSKNSKAKMRKRHAPTSRSTSEPLYEELAVFDDGSTRIRVKNEKPEDENVNGISSSYCFCCRICSLGIDCMAFVLFPVVFAIFNFLYWSKPEILINII